MTPGAVAAVAISAGVAVALLLTPRARLPASRGVPGGPDGPDDASGPAARQESVGWLLRHRLLWSVLAGAGAFTFLGGPAGPVAGLAATVTAWVVIGRAEPPSTRRRREEVARDLPAVVMLLGVALRSGSAPADAVGVVARALPGEAADRLVLVAARLSLGSDPAVVWGDLAEDPDLGVLGRTLRRSHVTGAPVAQAVGRLGDDLAQGARAAVEDRARAVGVQAAVPLGLCLLPSFLLIGIVPLVAGLMTSLAW